MCGIAGIYDFVGSLGMQIEEKAKRVSNSMLHRGPDAQGFYYDENVALIHNRLSIIDLSTGDQPILNEDASKVIILNGEVYNYLELREELLNKGHRFKSSSDTEVVLHGYEEWGFDIVKKMIGMFSFAIWDKVKKSMFLARDRMGEKPLYYMLDDNKLIFASELKGVIASLEHRPEIDFNSLQLYFAYKFIPEPFSIYTGINKLEKASFLYVEKGQVLKKEHYWDVKELLRNRKIISSFNEAKNELRKRVTNAVEMQMTASDVPVGAFLSGGIDSSIVTGLMAKMSRKPINTFCIGFTNKKYDESSKAQQIAEIFKTNHYIHYLEYNDVINEFDKVILNFDEPFSDSSCIPTYYVSKLAAQKMKVVLTGDGADELFAGYKTYDYDQLYDRFNTIPKQIRPLARCTTTFLAKAFDTTFTGKSLLNRVNRFWDGFNFNSKLELRKTFNSSMITELMNENKGVVEFDQNIKAIYGDLELNSLEYSMLIDQNIILDGDMLVKVDRSSMLNSLETRAPFMDKNVVEYSLNIPTRFKKKGKVKKYILKEAFSDLIPTEIINQKKQGFAVPIGDWMRSSLKSELDKITERNLIKDQGIFNINYINEMKQSLYAGKDDEMGKLWSLYVFQKWYNNVNNGQ